MISSGGELIFFVADGVIEGFASMAEEFALPWVIGMLNPNSAFFGFCGRVSKARWK